MNILLSKAKQNAIKSMVLALLLLPGCLGWGRHKTFCAWHLNREVYWDIQKVDAYIRSAAAYDQFSTIALFDALILSDQIRCLYSKVHSARFGKSKNQEKILLRNELKKNDQRISFYVLSLHEVSLVDEQSEWRPMLLFNEVLYQPSCIRVIDMPLEYRHFFGERYTRFKDSYEIIFDLKDMPDDDVLLLDGAGDSPDIVLEFRSLKQNIFLRWHLDRIALTNSGTSYREDF